MTALWRKSNGVPATSRSSPVGISVSSTGVYASALTMSRWSRMLRAAGTPARLNRLWFVRLTIVGLSVVAS